jgi:hypothetical protein
VKTPAAAAPTSEEDRLRRQRDLIAAQQERIDELLGRIEELEQRNDELMRQLFGRTSEKLDPQKLKLAAEAVKEDEAIAETVGPVPAPPEPPPPERAAVPRKGGGRRPEPKDLPVVEVMIDLPAAQKICPTTGVALVKINELVTEEIEWVPGHFIRKRYIRYVYAHQQKLFGPLNPPLPEHAVPLTRRYLARQSRPRGQNPPARQTYLPAGSIRLFLQPCAPLRFPILTSCPTKSAWPWLTKSSVP